MILCEDQGKMKLAAHANKYGLMMNAVVKIQGLIFLRIFRESIAGGKLSNYHSQLETKVMVHKHF